MHNQHKILRVFQLITMLQTTPPKSVRYLAGILKSTDRTVYRYLDLLQELGFSIQRDGGHRIFINGDHKENGMAFSVEEVKLMKELVLTVGKNNKIRDSILQKLYVNSDLQIQSELLLRAHLGKIVEDLGSAITNRHQVILKKYHSANSNDIKDRLVEPIKFSPDFQRLVAYEISSGKNKTFNIERIAEVKITKKSFKHEAHHKYTRPDVFGFSDNGRSYPIDLLLTLRACVILKEEYPMTVACINLEKSGKYRCTTTVYDLKPVTRFVLGFLDEIEVRGPLEFKEHLKQHVKKMIR